MPIQSSISKPARPYLRRGHPSTDKLIGIYPFFTGSGSTLRDISGWGNHGTITGGEWRSTKYGPAVRFSGGGSGDNAELPDFGWGNSTPLSVIFRLQNNDGGQNRNMFGRYDGTDDIIQIFYGNNQFVYRIGHVGGNEHQISSSSDIPQGTWGDVGISWDPGNNEAVLYFNGEQEGSATGAIDDFAVDGVGPMISNRNGSGSAFSGDFALCYCWNRALHPAEFRQLHGSPLTPFITKPR